MDGTRHSGRLHAAGQVHGVAPQIVDEFDRADDASHHRPGVETDTELQVGATIPIELPKNAKHVQSHLGHYSGVVRTRLRQTAYCHVAITNRLDLLDAVPLAGRVKPAKQVIEQRNQFPSRCLRRESGEAYHIGEKNRDLSKSVGDALLAVLQALRDRARQDVQKQALVLRVLLLDELGMLSDTFNSMTKSIRENWVIESRMNLDEALKPVSEMRRLFSWWGAALLFLTVMAALLMTRQILRPVNALVGAARRVAAGDLTAQVEWKWKDELGMLSDTFNSMTKSIRENWVIESRILKVKCRR